MTIITAERERNLPAIPKLGFWGAVESLGWVLVIGHLIKWAVDALYFLITQVKYSVSYGGHTYTVWYLKDFWDHAPRWVGRWFHIKWLMQPWVDKAWVVPRHDARALIIGIFYGVAIHFLFSKPKPYRPWRRLPAWRFAVTPLAALVFAAPGIAAGIGIVSRVPWVVHHGLAVPGASAFANWINGWVGAGHWHIFLIGLIGSYFFARFASRRPADEAQWFYAERQADAMRSTATGLAGVGAAVRRRVIGPPGFRARVRYLVDNDIATPARSALIVWLLVGGGVVTILLAILGAYLTIWGPAAGA
jgi:hypothetical protein